MEKCYLIYAGTGCTCCNNENHYRGPYKSKEDAERRVVYYKSDGSKYWPLASQFARRGTYSIEEVSFEDLNDGRIILGGTTVISDVNLIDVNEDGTIEDDESEHLYDYD